MFLLSALVMLGLHALALWALSSNYIPEDDTHAPNLRITAEHLKCDPNGLHAWEHGLITTSAGLVLCFS